MQELTQEDRTWGMLCHIAALAGIPFPVIGNFVGPLVVWMLRKDQSWFVNDQGKESINFQISIAIYSLVAGVLVIVLIGIPLLFVLGIGWLVLTIMAAIKANNGEAYRYPLTIRLLK